MPRFAYAVTDSGAYATNDSGVYTDQTAIIVDNFEDGNRNGWNVPSSSGGDSIVSPGLNGTGNAWQHTGLREGQLPGSGAIDRGPQPGDRFNIWFRIDSTSGEVINRIQFSADGTSDGDCYRFEIQHGDSAGNEYRLQKISGGSVGKESLESGSPSIGQAYRVQFDWNRGNTDITVQVFRPNGNSVTNPITITDDSPQSGTDYTQPGVFLRTNANCVCTWDEIRITDSG